MKHEKTPKEIRYSISEGAAKVIDIMQAKLMLKGEDKTKAEVLDYILLDYKKYRL